MSFRPWMGALFALALVSVLQAPGACQETTATSEGSGQAQVAVAADLASPRDTMRTLLRSVNRDQLARAADTLDCSELDPPPSPEEQQDLAKELKALIDRIAYVRYEALPDHPEEDEFTFAEDSIFPLVMARGEDGLWRFSGPTVAQIGEKYEEYKDLPVVKAAWWRRFHIGDNEIWHVGALFLSLLLCWILGHIVRWILTRSGSRLENRRRLAAITLQALGRAVVPLALVLGLSIGLKFLVLNATVSEVADVIVNILGTIAVAYGVWCLVAVVESWLSSMARRTSSTLDDMLVPMVRTTLKATVVIMALVQVATILSDKPITSVIAGLGIGGLAIGLAAQDMVKNFFGSVMIFSDHPFELGDRIQVEGFDGTIEAVGFRSTKLRTLDGHLVTIPNGSLANLSIRNVSRRPNIRRILNIGLTYDTPPDKVRRAKEIVEELLANHEGMDPEMPARAFFNEFNDSALNLFVIYWYHPPDWWAYCEFSEWLNMEILSRFNAENIEFAFPSQTLYLAGDSNRPLKLGGASPR